MSSLREVVNITSFGEALLLNFTLLFTTLLVLYIINTYRGEASRKIYSMLTTIIIAEGKPARRLREDIVKIAILALSILVLILGVIPIYGLKRPTMYFALQGILGGLVTYQYLKRNNTWILGFYTITAIVSIPVIVFYHNNFYPLYSLSHEALYTTGRLHDYMESATKGGFYYFIPIDSLIMVELSYLVGWRLEALLPVIRLAAFYTVIFLASIVAARRTNSKGLALLPLIYAITPTLAFQYRVLSLPFAMLAFYFLALGATRRTTSVKTLLLSTPVIAVMVFAHPVGPLAMMALLAILAISSKISRGDKREIRIGDIALKMLVVLVAIALSYWFATYIYSLLVPKASKTLDALTAFIERLIGKGRPEELILGKTISKYTAPGYSNPKFYIYAYNWALPVALTAITYLVGLASILRRKSPLETLIGFAAATAGALYILTAYVGYTLNIEPGQYLIPTGYFAASIAAATTLSKYSKNKASLIALSAIIAIGVGLGLHSPSWAPLEHPDFEVAAAYHPYSSYIEGSLFKPRLSLMPIVYSDYDIVLKGGNYKDVRRVLGTLIKHQNIERIKAGYYTIAILASIRLKENQPLLKIAFSSDLIYFSDNHIAFGKS